MIRTFGFLLLSLLVLSPVLVAQEAEEPDIDEDKIYYGDPDNFKKPGECKIAAVFGRIPEYQEAKKKGKDDPQYYILLEKANEKFFTALATVSQEEKYDLIGEKGSIRIKGRKIPDITSLVIKALPE